MRCPAGPSPTIEGCADQAMFDTIYSLCDSLTARVNSIISIVGGTPLAPITRPTVGACLNGLVLTEIKQYLEAAVATGYVKKYAEYPDGMPVPFPSTLEEVQALQECDAFWLNLAEVSGCMGAPITVEGCLTGALISNIHRVLACLINEQCSPCQCPVCAEEEGCQACNDCITLLVEFSGMSALIILAPHALGCVKPFTFTRVAFRYNETQMLVTDPAVWLSGTLYLVKGCAAIHLVYEDESSLDPADWWSAENIVEYACNGVPEPGHICTEWRPDTGTATGIFVNQAFDIYKYAEPLTIPQGEVTVSAFASTPICHKPWTGLAPYYRITMSGIPDYSGCDTCTPDGGDNCQGWLTSDIGGGLSLYTGDSPHWHGVGFQPEVTFDPSRCTYLLKIRCSGSIIYQGLKFNCGGPEGTYRLDPDFDNPCFYSDVDIAVGPDSGPVII